MLAVETGSLYWEESDQEHRKDLDLGKRWCVSQLRGGKTCIQQEMHWWGIYPSNMGLEILLQEAIAKL